MLRWQFIHTNTYIKINQTPQINNLNFYPKKLEKQQQTKHKASRKKEIKNNMAKMNELGNRKTMDKINETKVCSLKRSKKLNNI